MVSRSRLYSIKRFLSAGKNACPLFFLCSCLLALMAPNPCLAQTPVFINELHYDNSGADVGEGVEIAGPAATDLHGWTIALYNGSSSQRSVYDTIELEGVLPEQCDGFGTLAFFHEGIQNGAPDGMALVDGSGKLVQFLSYEGSFTAADGPAAGMTSVDIGVSEASSTPQGHALQLAGSGIFYEDFAWQPASPNTFGECNGGQVFSQPTTATVRFLASAYQYHENGEVVTEPIAVQRFGNLDLSVRVNVAFHEGSATAGSSPLAADVDFDSSAMRVVFAPQQTQAEVPVILNDDEIVEGIENFGITLVAADSASIAEPDSAVVEIVDNDRSELLVINEVLADPAASLDGDANGDGVRDGSDDEFVELVNISGDSLDLSGWRLSDATGARHIFPDNSVIPNLCAVVIFGGGEPGGTFMQSVVQTASSGTLGLNNSGDILTIDDGSMEIASLNYGAEGGRNQSITREPDITGSDFVLHSGANGAGGALFSPGTLANGSPFPGCAASDTITGSYEIFQIQGSTPTSPLVNTEVETQDNIVIAVGPEGFFIQTPSERADGDAGTSDGLYVFTGSAPAVQTGDRVDVTGQVVEFFDFTQIANGPEVTVRSSGNELPPPFLLDEQTPSPSQPQAIPDLERLEGMRVRVEDGTVCSGNQRFSSDPMAEVHVVAGQRRAFREPGIAFPGRSGLPVWDGNPELFELDPDRLGLPNREILAGSRFTATGVLGFEFGGYELWPTQLEVESIDLPRAVRKPQPDDTLIGTLNLLLLSSAESDFQSRLAKLSGFIRLVMRAPAILAVQEVENITSLQFLADKIRADDAGIDYAAYLQPGRGDINTGFLVRQTVQVDSVVQMGAREQFDFDGSFLHDRPPLILRARLQTGMPVTIMNLHMRSRLGIETSDSTRVRRKRHQQALSVSRMIARLQQAEPDIKLIVTGDFNAFEFTDGYAHVLWQIMGKEAGPGQALLPGSDEFEPDLVNEILRLPRSERYSFVFDGSAQALDHILTSQAMHAFVSDVAYARGNADVPAVRLDDGTTPLRASDHDGLVLYISESVAHNLNHMVRPEIQNVRFELASGNFEFDVRWTNTSSQTLSAPLVADVIALRPEPPVVSVLNSDNGMDGAGAVFEYELASSAGGLSPGESTAFKRWIFQDSSQTDFTVHVDLNGLLQGSSPQSFSGSGVHAPFVLAANVSDEIVDIVTAVTEVAQAPGTFALHQNFPNPFNPMTTIRYELPRDSTVRLTVFNLTGQQVRVLVDRQRRAGAYEAVWDGRDDAGREVASGLYVYTISADRSRAVRKLLLLK